MSTRRDPDALLSAYLADGMDVLPERVIDAVLDEAHRTRQRAVLGPWRTPTMNSFKLALAGAAVVVVLVAGLSLLPSTQPSVGVSPVASPTPEISPSSEPSPSPLADRMGLGGTDQHFSVQLPEGWTNHEFVANDWALGGITAFFVSLVDNTMEVPCERVERSPKVGPSVADLATALGEIPGTTATAPTQVTVAGYDATYLEVTLDGALPCAEFVWWLESPESDWWAIGDDETLRVWIFEQGGRRVAIGARSYPDTTVEAKAELEAILDSIVFDEPTAAPSTSPSSP